MFSVYYNALVFNFESPVMHWCGVNEKIKKNSLWSSPWTHLSKNKNRFEFSISCSLCALPYFCCMSLNLCLNMYVSVPLYLSLWNSPFANDKQLCFLFNELHRKHHMVKGWDNLQKSLATFYKIKSHWLQLVPVDGSNKWHCVSNNIHRFTFNYIGL